MKHLMEKLEQLLELGGIKKDVTFLVISGIAVICSLLKWNPLPFDMAWVVIVLCGIPIILEGGDRAGHRLRHQGGRAGIAGADRLHLHRRDVRRQ